MQIIATQIDVNQSLSRTIVLDQPSPWWRPRLKFAFQHRTHLDVHDASIVTTHSTDRLVVRAGFVDIF